MAIKVDAGKVVRGEELRVDPKEIIVGANYSRFEDTPNEDALQEMIESIQTHGQLQPIRCRRSKPENKLILVSGRTRYEAIQWINAERGEGEKMMIRVSVFDGNEADAAVEAAIENSHRNDTTPMDKARTIKYLQTVAGKSTNEIAKILRFKTPASIYQYQGLLSLDTKTQRMIHAGVITFSDALKLLKTDEATRADIVNQIAAASTPVPEPAAEVNPLEELLNLEVAKPTPDASITDMVSQLPPPNPARPAKAAKTDANAPKAPRTTVAKLIRQNANKPMKRSITDVREFFDVMIGGKASPISLELQAISKEMLALIDGLYDDGKQVERFELLVANIKGGKTAE